MNNVTDNDEDEIRGYRKKKRKKGKIINIKTINSKLIFYYFYKVNNNKGLSIVKKGL